MEYSRQESGQTIILIVITFFLLLAVGILVVDGSNAYLGRRQAQNAADAGALAGAFEYCVNNNDPTTIITEYVEDHNGSILENWYIDGSSGEIVVEVSRSHSNFFAKLIGRPVTTVRADASAGCFPPGAADNILPIAWSCRPPLPGIPSDSPDCEWKAITWTVMEDIINDPNFIPTGADGTILYDSGGSTAASYLGGPGTGDLMIYMVMDSIPSASEIPCIQTDPINGTVDCDLDGDNRIDILGNGDRSWLILDGDANNAQLDDIVRGELEFSVSAPTWYPGRDGAIADVYKDARNFIEGTPALIPVFESFCAPTSNPLTDPLCQPLVEPGDGLVQISTAESSTYFRVVSFAEFYITCISNKLANKCPGKELAISHGIITQSTPSIEGYFIKGWAANSATIGTGSSQIDLGIYVLSLTE